MSTDEMRQKTNGKRASEERRRGGEGEGEERRGEERDRKRKMKRKRSCQSQTKLMPLIFSHILSIWS